MKNVSTKSLCASILCILGLGCAIDPGEPPDEPTGTATSALLGYGATCSADAQCASGTCNSYLHQCYWKGGIGTGCNRDFECSINTVCNTYIHQCAWKGGIGASCNRDFECASGVCNTYTHKCAWQGGLDAPCARDFECVLGRFCNTITHRCT